MRAGQIAESIDAHVALLSLRPNLPDSWFNLAWLQRQARRFEDSLTSYAKALEHGASGPEEIHLNRAVILSEHLDRLDDAERELNRAIAINPNYLEARLNLGNLYEDQGNLEAAKSTYGSALAIMPTNGRSNARLAVIDVFSGNAAAAVQRLQNVLIDPRTSSEDRAEVLFALGNAFDAAGEYDRAFAAYEEGNTIRAALARVRYDPRAAEELIDTIIATFPGRSEPIGPEPIEPPIFICGMFRSGSTLAEQILGRHKQVTAGGELDFMPALIAERIRPFPDALAHLGSSALVALRDAYLNGVHGLHGNENVITDKRPDNFLYIGLIKRLMPSAKIIHTVREPLDNILSVYFLDFEESVTYGSSLFDTAHWYQQYGRLMAHWKSLYGEDIHDFDYDRTVRDPEPEVRNLLQFCGLDWEASMLTPSQPATVRTASVWQVRQPLHTRSSGRWRNYAAHLEAIKKTIS